LIVSLTALPTKLTSYIESHGVAVHYDVQEVKQGV